MLYELNRNKAKITEFKGREGHVQEVVDRIQSRARRLKGGIDRICAQLVDNWQLDL